MSPSGPEYAYAVAQAKKRYEQSGHTDDTLYMTEALSIALHAYIHELKEKHPGHPSLATAATAAGSMQSTLRYLVKTYRHYFHDPHTHDLSHHDVVGRIVQAVTATADDEVPALRNLLRHMGFTV
jgi:hypothetical protein